MSYDNETVKVVGYMNTRLRLSPRGIGALAASAVLLAGVPFLGASEDVDVGWGLFRVGLAGVVVVLVVVVVVRVAATLAGVDPDARLIADQLASQVEQRRLLVRWLERTRWARNVGGYAGITWWVLGTSFQGDVLLYGVAGITLGSMAAQLTQVRSPAGPRTASLDRRVILDYLPVKSRRRMIGIAAAAIVMTIGGIVVADTGSAIGWGVAALIVLGLAHLVQRRVATRPRPALNHELRQGDDLARELAIGRGLAHPASYCALALIAHGARNFEPVLGWASIAVSAAVWLYALGSWMDNRRLGLDFLIDEPQPGKV